MYAIFWSRAKSGKERRLPYELKEKEKADGLCKILNSYFSPEIIHTVREVSPLPEPKK